ncbi:endonuclease III [Candidatus Micrarchaeota archaeon RBG_16_49_10]|nr:MAG: endonuclease III [Candidatus Micrarchaeota archaeon RBG_16_49_10]
MEIERVIGILKRSARRHREPVITGVARREDPFQVLVSCLISLRTKDSVTEVASKRLFKLADTPKKMAKLPEKAIQKAIYPAGFYRNKSRVIRDISRDLVENYGSRVPDSIEKLLKFKGVGRKTANIVVTQAFGKPGIAVDIHVHVVANRLGWVKTKTPDQTELALMKVLPKKYWRDVNELLIVHGQNVCVTVSPWCSKCPIEGYCPKVGVTKRR